MGGFLSELFELRNIITLFHKNTEKKEKDR